MAGTSLAASLISLDFVSPDVDDAVITPAVAATMTTSPPDALCASIPPITPASSSISPAGATSVPDSSSISPAAGATSVIPVILTPTADGMTQVVTLANQDNTTGAICDDSVIMKEEQTEDIEQVEGKHNGATSTQDDGINEEDVIKRLITRSTQSETWEELATNLVLEVVTQQVTKIRGLQETTGPSCVHIDGMTWKDIVAMIVEKHNKTCGHTGVKLHHNMVGMTSKISDQQDTAVVGPPPLQESRKRKGVRTRGSGRGRGKMVRGRGQFGPKNTALQDNSLKRSMTSFEAEFQQTVENLLADGHSEEPPVLPPVLESVANCHAPIKQENPVAPPTLVKPLNVVGINSNPMSIGQVAAGVGGNIDSVETPDPEDNIIDISQCKICKKWFKSKLQLIRHNTIHDEDRGPHPCKVCKKLFKTEWNLEKHMENMHKEVWQKEMKSSVSPFKKMSRLRVAKRPYTRRVWKPKVQQAQPPGHQLRPINEHAFEDEAELVKTQMEPSADQLQDNGALAEEENKNVLKPQPSVQSKCEPEEEGMDDNEDDEDNLLTCGICDQSYASEASLTAHQQTHKKTIIQVNRQGKIIGKPQVKKTGPLGGKINKSSMSKCLVCKEVFRSKMQLEKHMSIHSQDNGEHLCKQCGKSCRTEWNLKRHLAIHAKVKQHKCPDCNTMFSIWAKLMQHRAKEHGHVEMYSCKECGVKYKNRITLKYHMMEHAGGEPYECDVCDRTFTRPDALRRHKHQHLPKKFMCSLCPKAYQFHSMLVRHTKFTHSKDNQNNANPEDEIDERLPYQCSYCGKHFLRRGNYIRHEKFFHNDPTAFKRREKSLQCTMCNSSFMLKHQLEAHENQHKGIKPYNCKECSKGFSSKQELSRHTKVHINRISHECSYCGDTFPLKTKLEKHEMEKHLQLDSEQVGGGKKTVVVVMKLK